MLRYNLVECSDNYSMSSGSLQNFYRDEISDDANKNSAAYIKLNNKKTITGKSWLDKIEREHAKK